MLPLDAGVRAAITELVFRQGAPLRADYTIVLGMTLWQNPLAAALRLYEAQSAGRLVFTGGYNPRIGRAEGEVMAEAAIAQGIPLAAALQANPEIAARLEPGQIAAMCNPENYLGSATTFVDQVLARMNVR